MRNPEVVYHKYVSFLPAIKHQVLPHHIPHVQYSLVGNGRTISKLCVHAHMIMSHHVQVEEAQDPHEDCKEEVLEFPETTPHSEIFLVYHRPMKYLQKLSQLSSSLVQWNPSIYSGHHWENMESLSYHIRYQARKSSTVCCLGSDKEVD